MRSSLRLTSIVALACGLSAACVVGCGGSGGSTEEPLDTEVPDTSSDSGAAEVEIDSTLPDTTVEETDTGGIDTGEVDTGLVDTGEVDTGLVDTGEVDTGLVDTGEVDTGLVDTGEVDTGLVDTGMVDTGLVDTGIVDLGTCEVGGACDDGNACTVGEAYNSSCVCTGGTARVCDDSNACTTDTCNPTSGCQHAATGEGTFCAPGKKCNLGVCDTVCTPGSTCTDSNACTTGEKLNDECVCTGGTTVTCTDDGNPCTTEACSPTAGCASTPVADSTSCGGTKICKAGICVDPSTFLPTIKVTAPAALTKKGFKATGPDADTCNPLPFTLSVTAPLKIKTVSWHFFTPITNSGMNGDTCVAPATANPPWRVGLGTPIYAHKIDETKYVGLTNGTFTEDVAVSGLSSGGLWLWCTAPGSGGTAFLTAANGSAIPGINGGLQQLSRYCHSTTLPANTDVDKQWTLIVQVTDEAGNKASDEIKFWLYKL